MKKATDYITKARPGINTMRTLRSFLDTNEPKLVYFLHHTWDLQQRAITYKELREAILNGYLPEEYLEQWRQDYSRFVVEHLRPAWVAAMEAAADDIRRRHPQWYFDPYEDGVLEWCNERAAQWVVEITNTQMAGLQSVITRAAFIQDMTVDQLARAIRPMVGLYDQQATANLNYYQTLISNGIKEEKARDLAMKYAAKQHRYRGYNIARTELAFSYNQGSYFGVKQAQAAGYMGQVVKVWSTADDERVCSICGALDGKVIDMDEDFSFKTKLTNPMIHKVPPAHPGCRCGVMYREVAAPEQIINGKLPRR